MPVVEHQREAVRNRLLRRLDWRFLLGDPEPARTVCFCNGALAEAIRQLPGEVVAPTDARAGACDLAIVVDPDPRILAAAWETLREGGSFYVEWHAIPPPGARAATRILEGAGFVGVTCYVPRPDPTRASPTFWIPLSAAGATHYVHRYGPTPGKLRDRIRQSVGRMRHWLRPNVQRRPPLCAVARKPAVPTMDVSLGGDAGAGDLIDFLRSGWQSWRLGDPPSRLSTMLLTGGSHSLNKVVALVFGESERQPRLAIKFARSPEAIPGLLREAENLRTLETTSRVVGAPRLLFLEQSSTTALGETALTGTSFDGMVNHSRYRTLAQRGTDWLIQLAGRSTPMPPAAWAPRLVEPVLAEFKSEFGPVVDGGLLREAAARLHGIGQLPLVWEQRDFAPWNLLDLGGGKLGVLDWESAEPAGLPAMDLIYYLAYLGLYLDAARGAVESRQSYRRSLDPSTFTGSVRREMIAEYAAALGLDLEAVSLLRTLVWMLHSHSEYRRMAADVGGRPEPALLRRSVCLALWEEDLRGELR
jgi:hypothetical protein